MKLKEYETPVMEMIDVRSEDVICTSGGSTSTGEGSIVGDGTNATSL